MKGYTTMGVAFSWTFFVFGGETVLVNGELKVCTLGTTVAVYLEAEGYESSKVAVELNGTVIKRDAYQDIILKPDDRIEIVSFVGGG